MAYKGNTLYFRDLSDTIDFSKQDRAGKTALDIAKERSRTEILDEINKHLLRKLETALSSHDRMQYDPLIAQGAPYSPSLVESANESEKEPLKLVIAPHAIKTLNSNLSALLSKMREHGKVENQQQRFEEIRTQAHDIEKHYNPLTKGLPYSGLAKHIGGIFRDAAKEAGIPLQTRRTFKQWASDIAHGLGYKKKEREAIKKSVGYESIVGALKDRTQVSQSTVHAVQTLSTKPAGASMSRGK